MDNCIFCKIAQGQAPVNSVYEDESIIAFHDRAPQAPIHILVIPKTHIPDIMDSACDDGVILGQLMNRARLIARDLGLEGKGARFIINYGKHGGQTVGHLHVHVMGGKQLRFRQG